MFHPLQRRFRAESLIRLRSADESRRTVAAQRSGRLDANPHQIDAVVFALRRIPEGGCILADEVGLGKTIEAGLVIAQLRAEGARRVLVITPKSLLGQWRDELFSLFGISARPESAGLEGTGVFLVTRDFAGGPRGAEALAGVPAFDLCVIDEAHEIFAGVYKRFDRAGNYREEHDKALMAGRVREVLQGTPMLLLTATPIQNSLAELWGLAQWVEPSGALLGDLPTFRAMFCGGDDRQLARGQEDELRARVAQICQRTLRRQAQPFMKKPFVGRRTKLFEYAMRPAERELYEDVTGYLLEPGICAFRGNYRRLLLIGFHRRMASSLRALAASLDGVAARLEGMLEGRDSSAETAERWLSDLEEDGTGPSDSDEGPGPPPEKIAAELERVRSYAARARDLPGDGKIEALVRAVRLTLERGGRLVIFTESLATQDYIREELLARALVSDGDVTLFRGTNTGPRVDEALARWREERADGEPLPPKEVQIRLALVAEFARRSRIFIATEAGAKGLNLQCADTLINYDLPWNPQRIEQRIGRIHRYGQTTDVTVVNFIARGNEAQRLTFEILSQKVDLFGTVLDASDQILYEPGHEAPEPLAGALGSNFEAELRKIYENARSAAEIEAELRRLRERTAAERSSFEATHQRTAHVIESRFDAQVQRVFRQIEAGLPQALAALDRDLEQVLAGYLEALGVGCEREAADEGARLRIAAHPRLPEACREGLEVLVGDARGREGQPLHLGHPLIEAAVAEAREATARPFKLRIATDDEALRGRSGQLRLVRIRHRGFETVEHVLPIAVLDGDGAGGVELGETVLGGSLEDVEALPASDLDEEDLDDAVEELLFRAQDAVADREHLRFSQALARVETGLEDRLLLLRRQRLELADKHAEAVAKFEQAIGAEARTRVERRMAKLEARLTALDERIERLDTRADPAYLRQIERVRERRYRAPTVETLVDAAFQLA